MALPKVISFGDAVAAVKGSRTHLLLGNGFSRAFRDDIFAYDALFSKADFKSLSPYIPETFKALGTTDFEVMIRALRQAAVVVQVYLSGKGKGVSKQLLADSEALRELLARTIAQNHPDRPRDVTLAQYTACKAFLGNFENIYTVNYDLLLYWVLMQDEVEPEIVCDDGFRQPDGGEQDYVTWDVQKTNSQNIHYLHGALHIFDAGHEVQKFTWRNTQIALVDQIRAALASDRFPLFVAEGKADEKLNRIQHSGMLNRAYRSFSAIGGNLFVFGLSFAGNDEHLLKLLDKKGPRCIYVSLFGKHDSDANKRIIRRASQIRERRPQKNPVDVIFYDAKTAKVWG